MIDMGVNYVNLANGEDLIDLRNDSVTPETLAKGETAHNKKGELIVGTMVAGEGGTGGGNGIIEVPELPTENIDENAVYKLVNNVRTGKTQVYVKTNSDTFYTLGYILMNLAGFPSEPIIHEVDELPADMIPINMSAPSEAHVYVLRTNGIAYGNIVGVGVCTASMILFNGSDLYDKGATDDISAETEIGVFTSFATTKQITLWFIYQNGDWVEITSHIVETKASGDVNIEMLSGEYK